MSEFYIVTWHIARQYTNTAQSDSIHMVLLDIPKRLCSSTTHMLIRIADHIPIEIANFNDNFNTVNACLLN